MLRYSIAKLGRQAGRKKGTKADLPIIEGRLGTEKAYYAALRSMLALIATETRESIIPLYEAELRAKRAARAYTGDAGREWFTRLRQLAVQLSRVASDTVDNLLSLESRRHTDTFMAAAKRAIGIDLRAVVQQEDVEGHLRIAVSKGAALIEGLSAEMIKRIEMTVYENAMAGNSVATLRKQLQKDFAFGDNRAKLIARTETARFNSSLNQLRQEQAGVTSYVYITSRDERVRSLHQAHGGKTFKWSDPPSDGHPGTAPNCRCLARGIVEF